MMLECRWKKEAITWVWQWTLGSRTFDDLSQPMTSSWLHTQAQCDFQSSPLTVLLNPFPSIHQSQQTSSSSIWPVETYQTTLAEKMMIYLTSLSSELLNELITWTSVAQVEDVKYSSLTTLTAWIGVGIDHQGLKSLGLEMAMILS